MAMQTTQRTTARQSQRRFDAVSPYLLSICVVICVTSVIWLLRIWAPLPNVSLIYLIGLLFCAVSVTRPAAILCAVLSFLAFKYFFVEPIFTFTIDDLDDILRLGTFLVTAVIGGGMAVRLREQASAVQNRAQELEVLYNLSQAISVELDFDRIAPLIIEAAMQLLGGIGGELLIMTDTGTLRCVAQHGTHHAAEQISEAPLRSGGNMLGMLRVSHAQDGFCLTESQRQLLETLANQAALALLRSNLAQAAAHAEALAESDRLKSTLLSAISHDLRTPLAAITTAAEELVAEDVQWKSQDTREFGQIIGMAAAQLNRLLTGLLDLGRIEAGRLHVHRGWYNIAEIFHAVLQRFSTELDNRPLQIDVPDELPLVPVDYIHIEQVLWNVIQNALKYSPRRSPLKINAYLQHAMLILDIADRGPGIPPVDAERVFEKFYRLEQPNQGKVPGMGIGLTICRGLIEAHGGQITIHEHAGGGTIVRIALPLRETVVLSNEEFLTMDEHILVIDDDLQIRRLLRTSLSERNYRVTVASTGEEGLDIAATDPPALITLDLGLPDLDGLEVCRQFRSWTNVPILILSARYDEMEKVRVLDAGADDYLTKPFGTHELLARIRAALRRARPEQMVPTEIVSGELRIDLARRHVTLNGAEVRLTPTEYTLLSTLATHAGRVLTHQWLLEHVWGSSYADNVPNLHVFISQLRRKIEPQPARPRYIITEPGIGYRFRASE